jgi:hypothetical protein
VVVKGVVTKREKYEVAPPLVVGDEGLRMIMTTDRMFWRLATYACRCAVRVGVDVDGAIVIIVLEDRDPLCSGDLLFQETGDGLLLL